VWFGQRPALCIPGSAAGLDDPGFGVGRWAWPVARSIPAVVEGRPFINAMGVGLDAEVSHRFNRLTRRGLPAYAADRPLPHGVA
jgi:hypothetical protein